MADFFAIRAEIAEKLKEISVFKQIYTPLNSVKVAEMSQVTPSAHINFVRITPNATAGKGSITLIGQQWAVTVACRNAQSQMNDGDAVTDEAGDLLEDVIRLLSGWKPPSSRDALMLVDVKEGFSPSFCYLTAVFSSSKFIQ